jgi:transcriptional regulator with XRE-family HTH domain
MRNVDTSKIPETVRLLRKAAGLSQEELAREVGTNQQTIDRIERGKTRYSRSLVPVLRTLMELAQVRENVDLSAQVSDILTALGSYSSQPSQVINVNNLQERASTGAIPLYGCVGLLGGGFLIGDEPIDLIQGVQLSQGVGQTYAIYMTSQLMVPEFEPGDLLIIDPRLPPIPNVSCIVRVAGMRESRAFALRLTSSDDESWVGHEWNGSDKARTFPRSEYRACHRIVARLLRR